MHRFTAALAVRIRAKKGVEHSHGAARRYLKNRSSVVKVRPTERVRPIEISIRSLNKTPLRAVTSGSVAETGKIGEGLRRGKNRGCGPERDHDARCFH